MASGNHYETLGVKPGASVSEIKAAYRKIALRHHPDRNSDPASTRKFMSATAAYEELMDADRRRSYDIGLENEAKRAAEKLAEARRQREAEQRVSAARTASTAKPTAPPYIAGTPLPTQLARLSMLFSRGLFAEAEKLAEQIIQIDPRQSLPYAVMGDLARQRGKLDDAARQYSLAIQMEPRNALYLQRYEEVLQRSQATTSKNGKVTKLEPTERLTLSVLALGLIVLVIAIYIAISPEKSALAGFGPVASWTVGLVIMLFIGGIANGACLAVGNGLDRLDAITSGRIGPTVALGLVALVSFPAACVLYLVLGMVQKGFSLSTTRILIGISATIGTLGGAAVLSRSGIDPLSVLLWGGNLAYLGALCGWVVADSVRP